MTTKYSGEGVDMAEATELSLGLGLLLVMGLALGFGAFRNADVAIAHHDAYAMRPAIASVG